MLYLYIIIHLRMQFGSGSVQNGVVEIEGSSMHSLSKVPFGMKATLLRHSYLAMVPGTLDTGSYEIPADKPLKFNSEPSSSRGHCSEYRKRVYIMHNNYNYVSYTMVLGSKPTKAELGQASGLRDKNPTNL